VLTEWPGVPAPLVPDAQVVQIGERGARDPDYAFADIRKTAITLIEVFAAREADGILAATRAVLDRTGWPFWVHFDVDVLDAALMPAVDSPGSRGSSPQPSRRCWRVG
jgi:arginase